MNYEGTIFVSAEGGVKQGKRTEGKKDRDVCERGPAMYGAPYGGGKWRKEKTAKGFERWTIARRANRMNADRMFNDTLAEDRCTLFNVSKRRERATAG